MAKGKKAVSKGESPPNEFFRGEERRYDGGEKTIQSPVGSIFDAVSISGSNALERGLSEQGAGRQVSGKGKK
jgi:hypothetical protein